MGKRSHLAAVKSTRRQTFVYTPPAAAFDAARILLKVSLGDTRTAVAPDVLAVVLRGLRRANPGARILIMEGARPPAAMQDVFAAAGLIDGIDDNTRLADVNDPQMPLVEYTNSAPDPSRFPALLAPPMIADYECAVCVAALDAADGAAGLHSLLSLLPRAEYPEGSSLRVLYFTIGQHFHGSVVSTPGDDGHVVWGDDLLAVDEAACRLAGCATPDYLPAIRAVREAIAAQEDRQ